MPRSSVGSFSPHGQILTQPPNEGLHFFMAHEVYILQKDLPNFKAGTRFIWDESIRRFLSEINGSNGLQDSWTADLVQTDKEWFLAEDEIRWSDDDMIELVYFTKLTIEKCHDRVLIDSPEWVFNMFQETKCKKK